MHANLQEQTFTLAPADNERLANLCGALDAHLRQIEAAFGLEIRNHGHFFQLLGMDAARLAVAAQVITELYADTENRILTKVEIHVATHAAQSNLPEKSGEITPEVRTVTVQTKRGAIRGRTPQQAQYLQNILAHDLSFGIGPAGTGKTYLAVAAAVHCLEKDMVNRLVLVRPAVEAGEKLGFLPGDLTQKVDPYLRPLYDALYEMLGFDRVARLIERNVIEVAPLAFMRGRTLNEAFIILDEAQNTTVEQMKMFLTRIGFGAKVVVTGDLSQIDLPKHIPSGLKQGVEVLQKVQGVSFTRFDARDVVRHPLVARIVRAYDSFDLRHKAAE